MLKRAVMSVTLIFSLQACTTLEIVHADLELPCMPKHGVIFNAGETDSISEEIYSKFERIIITYKERIKTQCKLVNQHNEAHK